jgi:HD-GYP domain-containing protein (c-di-GMP phosphodiesterase class II)
MTVVRIRKPGPIGSRRPQASHKSEAEIAFERMMLTREKTANLTPSAATVQQLRAVAGAISRLWLDLGVNANALTRDHEQHSHRVALFSWRIARFMGLPEKWAGRILRAAYLHDVGSVGVPGAVMRKPESLTAEERKAMQVHPLISCELLGAFLSTEDLAGIALSHHERFDGDGYPNGLQGVKIPLEARVLAIADSLDAMMSLRPYRNPLPFSVALREITRGAGGQFDPNIVEVLAREGETIACSPSAPSVSA